MRFPGLTVFVLGAIVLAAVILAACAGPGLPQPDIAMMSPSTTAARASSGRQAVPCLA